MLSVCDTDLKLQIAAFKLRYGMMGKGCNGVTGEQPKTQKQDFIYNNDTGGLM